MNNKQKEFIKNDLKVFVPLAKLGAYAAAITVAPVITITADIGYSVFKWRKKKYDKLADKPEGKK